MGHFKAPAGRSRRALLRLLGVGALASLIVAIVVALAPFGPSQVGRGEAAERGESMGARDSERALSASVPPSVSGAVAVFIESRRRARRVPRRFLGLSFELSSLPEVARYGGRGNLVGLLRSLDPGVLRFGGVSADTRVAWTDSLTPRPPWASAVLSASDLHRLAGLAARSGWRVLLTIGLGHFEPRTAAREAAAAKAALGAKLAGIEIGNEPDAYMNHGLRPAPWTFSQYDAQAATYRAAIAGAARGIRLAGPDVSGSAAFASWGSGEAAWLKPALLTGHHYPLGCHEVPGPSIERLLSPQTRLAEGTSIHRYMSVARASRIRFRMDETNSVSCGGREGISDTFASALWALDYIVHNMAAGVAGVNFHGEPANCHGYTPLCAPTQAGLAGSALSARPEWYALLLARALIGDRPVGSVVTGPGRAGAGAGAGPNLNVIAFAAGGRGLHVVIVDDDPPGAPGVLVHLHLRHRPRVARILALSAPSPAASAGIRLGGRSVGADGSWREPRALPRAFPNRTGEITVAAAPSSAMLVTVSP